MSNDRILGDQILRIEVLEGAKIELLRVSPEGKAREPVHYDDVDAALAVIEMFIRAAHARALKEKFVPQLDIECSRELKKRLEAKRQ